MSTAKLVGRVGALAVVLGVGFAAVSPPGASLAEPSNPPSSDSTALLVCGASCPTWRQSDVEIIMDQFITPTHLGQTITPVAVTTPSESWPITGLLRLIGVAFGDPRLFGPGGAAWPDQPWWKLSGLFDLTADQSAEAGVAALEAAMAAHGNDHLVIFGESAGANTVNKLKRKLAAQYPPGTPAPDIEFVLMGDPNVPNGGLSARFPGLPTVILGTFEGPEPTDTAFRTNVINRQYDGAADFPLYLLNPVAMLNAVLGFLYVHSNPFDVSLAPDASTSPAYQGTHGDSSYYLFPTEDLPLFAPLRQLGVPESLIDVVEPFFRVLVELGYDRSIPPWEPTPARLIPIFDPLKLVVDLVNAIGEGLNNAAALAGFRPQVPLTAPVTETDPPTSTQTATNTEPPTSPNNPTVTTETTSTTVTETTNADASPQVPLTAPVTETDPPTSTQTATNTEPPTSPNNPTVTTETTSTTVTETTNADAESPWKSRRLLTLETRMESCRRSSRRGSRPRVAIAQRRRPPRCGWFGR